MPALSPQDRQSIDAALDFVLSLLDCLQRVPSAENTIERRRVDAIRSMVDELRQMAADGRIDFQPRSAGITAATDRHGIHLNSDFGGDYRNAYQLPGDYRLDDCAEGYFSSLWYLLEILFHELHHYRWHSGILGGLFKASLVFAYSVSTIVTFPFRLIGRGGAQRKYIGHEHESYLAAYRALMTLEHALILICHHVPDCLPCCEEHLAAARQASARQDPWE